MHSEGRGYALQGYDIGSFIETDDANFNPNTKLGGTWVLDQSGTVLVSKSNTEGSAFNADAGNIVGEEQHKLSVNEMPSHNHRMRIDTSGDGGYLPKGATPSAVITNTGNLTSANGTLNDRWPNDFRNVALFENSGGDQSHNNIQPSKVIYRWHRTA